LKKSDTWLDWSRTAAELDCQVRAFNPVPVAQARIDGEVLRIWEAESLVDADTGTAGTVLNESTAGIEVATGAGRLRLLRIQPAGKKPMAIADYINGRSLAGKVFETEA